MLLFMVHIQRYQIHASEIERESEINPAKELAMERVANVFSGKEVDSDIGVTASTTGPLVSLSDYGIR